MKTRIIIAILSSSVGISTFALSPSNTIMILGGGVIKCSEFVAGSDQRANDRRGINFGTQRGSASAARNWLAGYLTAKFEIRKLQIDSDNEFNEIAAKVVEECRMNADQDVYKATNAVLRLLIK